MSYLTADQIREIHSQAINGTPGLIAQWRQLLVGVPIGYTSMLPNIDGDMHGGLYAQLDAMNNVTVLKGGIVPLEQWLKNAAYFADQFPDSERVFRRYAVTIAERRAVSVQGERNDSETTEEATFPNELGDVPEKVIFVNDMVPFDFLARASRVGQAVARLMVPRFQAGKAAFLPASTEQVQYFGTGWLIGRKHVITNHHVINARDPGESDASDADFALQGCGTVVQFDYNQRNAAGDVKVVDRVVVANRNLDYSILELKEDTGRESLLISDRELALPLGSYVPVNLIQHPGGQPKKLGIRNNLVASLNEKDIAYFTDTEPGSSGSPVCSDDWQVVGLHKASTVSFGKFEFQGKKTAWVNTGTRIDAIIADLKNDHATLWSEIGASVKS